MDLSKNPKQKLIDLTIHLAASLKEEDLEDPVAFGLVSQLTQLLGNKPDPLPRELVTQLEQIQDKAERFRRAAGTLGLTRPDELDRLADSLKAADLINDAESRAPDMTVDGQKNQEPESDMKKSVEELLKSAREILEKGQDEHGNPIRGSNKRLQQSKVFGKPSDAKKDKKGVWQTKIPDANGARTSEQRQKMMSAIKGYAEKRYGAEMTIASGKRDSQGNLKEKPSIETEPYGVFTKEGVGKEKIRNEMIGKINSNKKGKKKVKRTDPKPDWRSGKLETQPSPDAAIHELAHLERHRDGAGLGQIQTEMDQEWGDSQKKHGHLQQKKTAGEIQPMAMENPIRRQIGLSANRSSKKTDTSKPVAQAIDGSGPRFNRAKIKGKRVGLDRQSRLMNEESKTRLEQNTSGERKFSPTEGWEQSDTVNAKINARAAGRRDIKQDAAQFKQQKQNQKRTPELRVQYSTHPGSSILAASETKVSKLKDRLSKARKR